MDLELLIAIAVFLISIGYLFLNNEKEKFVAIVIFIAVVIAVSVLPEAILGKEKKWVGIPIFLFYVAVAWKIKKIGPVTIWPKNSG